MMLHLLVAALVIDAASGRPLTCSYGDAHPGAGGGVAHQQDRLSCQPSATMGTVSVTVDLNETEAAGRYLQASV